jgi:hypothetical protein
MSRVSAGRRYGLVYLVYNTIGNLLTQDDQVRCFENAAQHLSDDGVFVLECRVPSAPSRPGHQSVDAERVSADRVTLDVCRYDPVTQLLDENHVTIAADGITLGPISLRLAQPPEFDLMARIACLRLRHRTGGRSPPPADATSASTNGWPRDGPTEPQRNLPRPGSRAARCGRCADRRPPQPSRITSLAVDDPMDSDKFRFDAGTSISRAVPPDPKCAASVHLDLARRWSALRQRTSGVSQNSNSCKRGS